MASQLNDKKKMSTRAQMLITGGLTIMLGFSVTIGVLSWQSGKEQKALAEKYLQQIAQSRGLQVQQELSHARDVASHLGQSLIALPQAGITDRKVVDKIMEYSLRANPDICRCQSSSNQTPSTVAMPNLLTSRDRPRRVATPGLWIAIRPVITPCIRCSPS
ncbi:hypothetical protein LZU96_22250 (plasmid) [Pantoea agglomerans]|nr:hypothetical protein LZU96_22250 [Pantoea agglomerans]